MKKQETSQGFVPKPVQMASAGYIFLTQWSRRVPSFLLAKLEGHVLQPMMNALNLTCPKCQCLEFSEFPGASKSEKWQAPHLAGHLGKLPADDGMLDQLLPDRWVMSHRICCACQTRGKCKRLNMGKNMHGSYDVECTICTMYKYGKKYMERSGCMIRACFLRFESHYPDLSGR